jgi:hypothetical protein
MQLFAKISNFIEEGGNQFGGEIKTVTFCPSDPDGPNFNFLKSKKSGVLRQKANIQNLLIN